jgi:xanthine dehydrogenase accessory factor
VATVVRVEAPTSAKPGDKAVITADGAMLGWIGGSCSEASIRREALAALSDGSPRIVRIAPSDAAGPGDNVRTSVSHLPSTVRDDETAGRTQTVLLATTCPSGGTLEIFLEPHLARPQLVAIGGSPAARTLIRLAVAVGFRTCVVHPGATAEDFPEADAVLPTLDLSAAHIGPDSWIAVATMGHYDEEALEAALVTEAAYVGLIASRRRRNAVVQVLRRRGWPGDALAGIVNPAGRTLGDSQEEIALSVLAEIVDRRNRRKKRAVIGELPAGSRRDDLRTSVPAPPPTPSTPSIPLFATDPVCGMAVEIAGAMYRSGDVFFCGRGCLEAYEASLAPLTPGPPSGSPVAGPLVSLDPRASARPAVASEGGGEIA